MIELLSIQSKSLHRVFNTSEYDMLVSSAPLVAHLACSGFVSVLGFGLVSGECRVEPIKSAFSENLSRRRKVGTAGAFSTPAAGSYKCACPETEIK